EENILPPSKFFDLLVEFGECYHYWIPQDNFTSTKTKGADGSAWPCGVRSLPAIGIATGRSDRILVRSPIHNHDYPAAFVDRDIYWTSCWNLPSLPQPCHRVTANTS